MSIDSKIPWKVIHKKFERFIPHYFLKLVLHSNSYRIVKNKKGQLPYLGQPPYSEFYYTCVELLLNNNFSYWLLIVTVANCHKIMNIYFSVYSDLCVQVFRKYWFRTKNIANCRFVPQLIVGGQK